MLLASTTSHASTNLDFFSNRPGVMPSSSSSTTNVVVRKVVKQVNHRHSSVAASLFPPSSSSPATSCRSSPLSSPSTPAMKRKSLPADLSVASSDSAPDPKRMRGEVAKKTLKKRKRNASSKSSSRSTSARPQLEYVYHKDRSRSTSRLSSLPDDEPGHSTLSSPPPPKAPVVFKRVWRTDEEVQPETNLLNSSHVIQRLMKSYKAHFRNPCDPNDTSFEPHPTNYPYVELLYPNKGAVEKFALLVPKDKDHYNPIYDIEKTLCTLVQHYCTPEQQQLFGPIPRDWLSDIVIPESESDSDSEIPLAQKRALKIATPPIISASSSFSSLSSSTSGNKRGNMTLLRAFQRAVNTRDGPMFLNVMNDINSLLRQIKDGPPQLNLMRAPGTWTETGLPEKVLMRVIEENYQRCVGPNVPKLKKYEAFTSTVYGELMPNLVCKIVKQTGLKEGSLFLDLGSGVGNVVVQASLQTGCRSFGVELMKEPARVARTFLEQTQVRCKMWGLRMGEVELEEGDMLRSKRVDELLPQADVVLVDNKVFEESLNAAIKPKFLDLKDGAIVISLKPFANAANNRVTDRNLQDVATIFDVTVHDYPSGSVSWGINGGTYYMHRVDRTAYAEQLKRWETRKRRAPPLRKSSARASAASSKAATPAFDTRSERGTSAEVDLSSGAAQEELGFRVVVPSHRLAPAPEVEMSSAEEVATGEEDTLSEAVYVAEVDPSSRLGGSPDAIGSPEEDMSDVDASEVAVYFHASSQEDCTRSEDTTPLKVHMASELEKAHPTPATPASQGSNIVEH
ncbi:DOT1-domain-containing protein [Coprinopsis marcescibilis]|uniref:Histone-lysine N-methyltransferase, H3 lysine-79 specific n=1 Tax=Coprinopsis marcescibilis TaxID=230819 RepID=A0A5C3KNH2_COPMA|nr:DOT1-domain-containing protein [Coprinopsis marcescibilis]